MTGVLQDAEIGGKHQPQYLSLLQQNVYKSTPTQITFTQCVIDLYVSVAHTHQLCLLLSTHCGLSFLQISVQFPLCFQPLSNNNKHQTPSHHESEIPSNLSLFASQLRAFPSHGSTVLLVSPRPSLHPTLLSFAPSSPLSHTHSSHWLVHTVQLQV